MPKPSPAPASDSSPALPKEADSLAGAGDDVDDGEEPLGDDQGEGDQEEEEVEEEDEEQEEGEEGDGAKREVEVEDEEEVAAEGNGESNEEEEEVVEEAAGGDEGADLSNKDDDDINKNHEDHCKEPKSVSSDPERCYIDSTNSNVRDVRGGNLNSGPSKSHNKKASEISEGDASQRNPLRRPRSSSPSTEHESVNKKAAIICDFFARGWCIKGNSCRFLHKKEGVDFPSHVARDDRATSGDSIDCKGSSEKVDKSNASASIELIGLSNTENSRKSGFLLQRALVRTYGGGIHGLPQIKDDDNLHASKNFSNEHFQVDVLGSGRTSYLAVDELRQKSMFREENRRTDDLIHDLDSNDDRHSASGEFPPRQYSNEGRMYQGIPRAESLNDASLSRASSFTKKTSEYDYFSGGSSTTTNVYKDCSNIYSYERRPGARLTHGSSPPSAKHEDIHRTFNYGGGFSGVTSGEQNIARSTLAFSGQKSELQENTWECSVPFRSSFCFASAIKSSESQCDPLVDCIDPPKVGIITSASARGIVNSMSNQHIVGDPMLGGDLTPGYNAAKSVNSFPPVYEGMLGIKKSLGEYCDYTTAVAPPGSTTDDGGINCAAKEEKIHVPHLTDAAHVNEADLGSKMRKVDKGKDTKESKAVKIFRAALIDFVKELLKPYWKEGHLSKDAHKMVVKKAVEKVLNALQPHQVSSDTDSINQYLSASRPRLLKLVEGYVVKYNKV